MDRSPFWVYNEKSVADRVLPGLAEAVTLQSREKDLGSIRHGGTKG